MTVPAPLEDTKLLRAKVAYIKPSERDQELYVYKYELPAGVEEPTNLVFDEMEVPVADLRSVPASFSLRDNGFQLERFSVARDVDWNDDSDVSFFSL